MPFRWSFYYVAAFVLSAVLGFWQTYFSLFAEAPFAFHFHASTALGWLILLAAQYWLIRTRNIALHRSVGKISFVLFPLLIVGLALITRISAERFLAAPNPVATDISLAVGIISTVSIASFVTLFFLALRHRHNLTLHGGYMLATPLIIFESSFGRVIGQYMPWLVFWGSEGARFFYDTIAISNAIVLTLALTIYFSDRKNGAPWLIASGFLFVQAVAVYFSRGIPGYVEAFRAFGEAPQAVTLAIALALGLATVWLGWRAGAKPRKKSPVRAQTEGKA